MARLANIEKGLSPKALRQLYIACVTSIADYGSVIWWRGQTQFKNMMQSLQNLALRKILGVFRTAPTPPMEVEAGLKPSKIRLDSNIRQYAFRLAKLSPNHPINIEKGILARLQANLEVIPTPRRKRYKPIQLDRIRESINQDFDPSSLEKIIHFNFPPWKREIPFRVNISNLSKEDAAILHNIVFNHRDKDTTYIYTDASSTEKGIGIGVGIVAIQPNNRILYQERSNIGINQLVYNGELCGVTRAIEYASSIAYTGQKFKIYSDNQAGLYRLKTPSDHPGQEYQIRAIKAADVIKAKGAEISLNWVPGHTSVEGNELADKLAKEATTIRPTSNETSFGLLGMIIKEHSSDQWLSTLNQYKLRSNQSPSTYSKLFPWKIGSKTKLPSGTIRNTASAFFQLKLGHGYIKSFLHRFKLTNNKCRCGKIEAPQHLLISCPIYKTERKEIFKKIPLSKITIQFLLHTKVGNGLAIKFINITKIATRAWHLARTLEQEVIEEGVAVEEERGEENEEEAVEEIREGFNLLIIS